MTYRSRFIRRARLALPALVLPAALAAQQDAPGAYRTPPAPISQILEAPAPPLVLVAPSSRTVAYLARSDMPEIADLSEPELRLAGVRISPRTNGPSRTLHYTGIALEALDGERREVRLPESARVAFARWSPDGTHLAFANTTDEGIELWVVDARSGDARRLTGPVLNAALGSPLDWMPDGASLLVRLVPEGRGAAPAAPRAPAGPVIQENAGRVAPVRTYQDLLATPHDERLFEHYFTSQLVRVPLSGAEAALIGEPAIYRGVEVAPGGRYLLVDRIKRPFSYTVPLYYFSRETAVMDLQGRVARTLIDHARVTPEPIGRDMELPGPRQVSWRADAPATLVWAEAQDEGDAKRDAPVRDRVLLLDAPFTGAPRTLIDLDQRYGGVTWGRADVALVRSVWRTTARTRTHLVKPSRPGSAGRVLFDRSYEDRYGDPGSPVTRTNDSGHPVLRFAPGGKAIYLTGEGASEAGVHPFLDRLDLASGRAERLWQSRDPHYETVVAVLDDAASRLLTRRESVTEPPNYYLQDRAAGKSRALTDFPDPAPQLAGIQRQVITYPRADGVMLNATLFTPPGYDAARDGPLPMLMWAYPREFRNAAAASQVTSSANRFSRPTGASHLFLLTQGYAILDGPAVPVIGEGEEEPNDRYVEQLVASMRAAVDKVVEMGVADRDGIGVGGHSYGAFMTANLLAHSDLFRAGIARSGAYNRTLTPFGFQAEPRTYWQARDVYLEMSPFNYADRIDEPILLIHGEADNNSGTFPMQSERLYQALAGHGATVRYVVLPSESHGYQARESVGHTLAEMVEWMDRHVKNAPPRTRSAPSAD